MRPTARRSRSATHTAYDDPMARIEATFADRGDPYDFAPCDFNVT